MGGGGGGGGGNKILGSGVGGWKKSSENQSFSELVFFYCDSQKLKNIYIFFL